MKSNPLCPVLSGRLRSVRDRKSKENEIPADFDGTVKKILVEKGQTVKAGETLIEVD